MARVECPFESEVMTFVITGQWPDRAPADLRAHVAGCGVCADVATVAAAIDAEMASAPVPQLPSSGTVWWRAQLRARQDAAREVARPITVAQMVALAAAVGVAGALFGATAQWFQRALARVTGGAVEVLSRIDLPSLSSGVSGSSETSALLVGYGPVLVAAGLGVVMTALVVGWVLRED